LKGDLELKKTKIIICFVMLLSLVFSTVLFAAADPLYLGSKTPYPYEKPTYTAAPAGYEPTFVYIAGRHGSRNLSGFKYDKTWLELLAEAEKADEITEMGKALKADIQKIADFEKGRYALLTSLGKKELYNIGVRTGENYRALFATGKPIFTDATVVDRAQESRDLFLEGLKSTGYNGEITSIFYKQNRDPYLRPYDIAQKFIAYDSKGKWNKDVEKFAESDKAKEMARRICLQFFSQDFYDRLQTGEFKLIDLKKKTIIKSAATAASALYELYIIGPSLQDEGLKDVEMAKYFTREELQMFERVQVAKEYYSQGPGSPDSNNISTNIMAPLVKRMINEVDSALAKKSNYIGVFSFAHAETEIPLVCFLEIGDSYLHYDTVEEAVSRWNTADFGPMAGNVQWIVYTAAGKEPLVKMLLLEKEVAFAKALQPVSGFYYKWADVREYYGKKVEDLGISLKSSIYDNIQSLYERF
jgi:multiple inositol-polyphosphate phosphatase/2,3-bisphosphoglycerate 3-phosphatase